MIYIIKDIARCVWLLVLFCLKGVPLYLFTYRYGGRFFDKRRVQLKLARSVVSFLQSGGPSFIKFGQILSTRADIVGDILAGELSLLLDRIPGCDYKKIFKTISTELGLSLQECFIKIDHKPVAAASIAQVHKAVLLNNQLVAVKVLRPGIKERFENDLGILRLLSSIAAYVVPRASHLNMKDVISMLKEVIMVELDLRMEAASADKMRHNLKDDPNIMIPEVFWSHSTQKVLTTQWVDAVPIFNKQALTEMGLDTRAITKNLAISFFNQAYRDGFFHADLHPGNIMVNAQGKIVLIDFGIMGYLNDKDRLFIAQSLYRFIQRDYKRVSDLHFCMKCVPHVRYCDRHYFELACRSIGEPIVGLPVQQISIGKLLKQLFDVSTKFNMRIQTQFLLLQKTMLTLEGVGHSLYPEINMWQLAEPWIKKWAEQNFGYIAKCKEAVGGLIELKDRSMQISKDLSHVLEEVYQYCNYNKHPFMKNDHILAKRGSMHGYLLIGIAVGMIIARILIR